jgi:hypothetical protein
MSRKGQYSIQKASPCNIQKYSEGVIGYTFLGNKFYQLMAYILVYHYWIQDEAVAAYCRLDLEDHILKNDSSFWLLPLLEEKTYFLRYLEIQETMSCNKFFSCICSENAILETISTIKQRFEKKLSKYYKPVDTSDYKDKGSLPNDPSSSIRRREHAKDYTSRIREEVIEAKRQCRTDTIIHFREFLSGDRSLSEALQMKFKIIKQGKEVNEDETELGKEITEKQRIIGTSDYEERKLREHNQESRKKDSERRKRYETTGVWRKRSDTDQFLTK